jgi:stage II sporulation protein D
VRECTIKTTAGSYRYGGDKIRFVLRRDQNGNPVLRSALITDISKRSGSIVMKGKGYGHGIGMCQFGAIGRARAGQSCEQILKAYYTGVEVKKIGFLKEQRTAR